MLWLLLFCRKRRHEEDDHSETSSYENSILKESEGSRKDRQRSHDKRYTVKIGSVWLALSIFILVYKMCQIQSCLCTLRVDDGKTRLRSKF